MMHQNHQRSIILFSKNIFCFTYNQDMYLSAVSRSALGYSFRKHKTRIDADHGATACNIPQLVVVGFRACAGKAEIQSEEMQFGDYLLGSLGRGCRSCIDLQEAAHAMVLESGGSCSSVTRKISRRLVHVDDTHKTLRGTCLGCFPSHVILSFD